MEIHFKFTIPDAPPSIMLSAVHQNELIQKFLRKNIGEEVVITFELANKKSEKERMYAYYHKVILGVAIQVFSDMGWDSMDKVKADHLLKCECAKSVMYNSKTDTEDVFLEDKKSMNKDRLYKFVTDCIIFLEIECGATIPSSEDFRREKSISGEKVNSIKPNKDF